MVSESTDGGDVNKGKLIRKDVTSELEKIVGQRVGWVFQGICALGTHFPDNVVSKSFGKDVGGTESTAEEWDRYRFEPYDYKENKKLLYFGSNIYRKGFRDNNINPNTIMMARVASIDPGMSEVIIAGKATTLDDRGSSAAFLLIQRMPVSASSELFNMLKNDPDLFDAYYQKAFPGLDSKENDYTGLWRLNADKIALLEEEDIRLAFQKNQGHRYNNLKPDSEAPDIIEQTALELIQSKLFTMSKPTGVGEISQFTPIKIRLLDVKGR
jgi:hypothetical protein